MSYKIEKNVPLPDGYPGRQKYPFDQMEIGDSILVPGPVGIRVSNAAYQWGKANKRKFRGKMTSEGMRIWRIE